jgi:ABC-type methionine transport system permease subunit
MDTVLPIILVTLGAVAYQLRRIETRLDKMDTHQVEQTTASGESHRKLAVAITVMAQAVSLRAREQSAVDAYTDAKG